MHRLELCPIVDCTKKSLRFLFKVSGLRFLLLFSIAIPFFSAINFAELLIFSQKVSLCICSIDSFVLFIKLTATDCITLEFWSPREAQWTVYKRASMESVVNMKGKVDILFKIPIALAV